MSCLDSRSFGGAASLSTSCFSELLGPPGPSPHQSLIVRVQMLESSSSPVASGVRVGVVALGVGLPGGSL